MPLHPHLNTTHGRPESGGGPVGDTSRPDIESPNTFSPLLPCGYFYEYCCPLKGGARI
jgi:hypothetical protein